MKLAYRAYDKAGRQVADGIEAANQAEAAADLRRKGPFATRIHGTGGVAAAGRKGGRRVRGGRRLKHLALFTRQLYVLVSSGTPVADALAALERQMKDARWQAAVADLRSQVEEGKSLSDAMAGHPEYFDAICRSLVAAGESGGMLAPMLDRLATMLRSQLRVRNALLAAMIYPTVLMVIATGVLGLLLSFVVPQFADLFQTLDAPLPATTKVMIGFSEAIRSYWWAVLVLIAAAAAGLKAWLAGDRGKRALHAMVLRLPQIGRMTRSFVTARIARLLGLLLEGRVPVVEALRLTGHAAGNIHYAELMTRAEDAVVRGESISSAFAASDLISPLVCEAIRNGERSGQVGRLLLEIAGFMDEDNENFTRSIMSILEPVILVVLGVMVGLVAVSLFMPLFDVTAMTQGGGR